MSKLVYNRCFRFLAASMTAEPLTHILFGSGLRRNSTDQRTFQAAVITLLSDLTYPDGGCRSVVNESWSQEATLSRSHSSPDGLKLPTHSGKNQPVSSTVSCLWYHCHCQSNVSGSVDICYFVGMMQYPWQHFQGDCWSHSEGQRQGQVLWMRRHLQRKTRSCLTRLRNWMSIDLCANMLQLRTMVTSSLEMLTSFLRTVFQDFRFPVTTMVTVTSLGLWDQFQLVMWPLEPVYDLQTDFDLEFSSSSLIGWWLRPSLSECTFPSSQLKEHCWKI